MSSEKNLLVSVPKEYFKVPIVLLQTIGISLKPIENEYLRFLYRIYSFILISFSIYIFLIIEFVECLILNPSVDNITFGLSYGVTHILGSAKVTLFLIKKNSLIRIIKILESGVFAPNITRGGIKEFHLINDAVKRANSQAYIFFTMAFMIIGLRGVYAMVDSGEDVEEFIYGTNETYIKHIKTMPYTTWFPFNKDKQPYYAIGFTYQIASTYIYGLFIGATDAILCGFLIHIQAQFRILKISLVTLLERSKQGSNVKDSHEDVKTITLPAGCIKVPLLTRQVNVELKKHCRKIVQHHQEILNLCIYIEDEICYLMLMQFLSSLFIICFQLYQLSSISPANIGFISMSLYLSLMIYQLYNYCNNGDEVRELSESLGREIFAIEWITFDEPVKKYLLMMIMRTHRASVFTAGKFALLSLQTFMAIVRGSGSYFMVLRQMNN